MKKMFFICVMMVAALAASAQNDNGCAQRFEAKANKLAAQFGLNDAKKAEFTKIYVEYMNAMKAAMPECDKKGCEKKECEKKDCKDCDKKDCKKGGKDCKKKECKDCKKAGLTDAEAKEMLAKQLEREANRIKASQKRLEVKKAYADKFQKVLTPQQTLKVMKMGGKRHGQKAGRRQAMQGRRHMMQGRRHMMQGHQMQGCPMQGQHQGQHQK